MLQVADHSLNTSIMSHPHYAFGPTNREVLYPYHIPPTPWELSSLYIPRAPCIFPSDHVEIRSYHWMQMQTIFLSCLRVFNIRFFSMKTLLIILYRYDHAYNILKDSFWLILYIEHGSCQGTCVIYDIPDKQFLQNLTSLLFRLDFIWKIMINTLINPFICRLVKLCRPPSLHPQESFDEITIAHIISIIFLLGHLIFLCLSLAIPCIVQLTILSILIFIFIPYPIIIYYKPSLNMESITNILMMIKIKNKINIYIIKI